jgi:hypothetical protein
MPCYCCKWAHRFAHAASLWHAHRRTHARGRMRTCFTHAELLRWTLPARPERPGTLGLLDWTLCMLRLSRGGRRVCAWLCVCACVVACMRGCACVCVCDTYMVVHGGEGLTAAWLCATLRGSRMAPSAACACARVCVCVRALACMRSCMCARMRMRMRMRVCVRARTRVAHQRRSTASPALLCRRSISGPRTARK